MLDQRKYQNKFDQIQNLLGLTDKERSQILSINLANAANRLYKEVWIGLGGTQSAVYATEFRLKNICATPLKKLKNWNLHALPKNWAETWSWPSDNLPNVSDRKRSNHFKHR